jgi:RNA recognition motif-containing protein
LGRRQRWAAAGTLTSVYLPTDRETGKPRGFAFLEFGESAGAQQAIARFNNQPFKGRPIAVSEARARDDRSQGSPPARPQARPSYASVGFEPPPPPSPAGGRNFGPDAPPRRNRKSPKSAARAEHKPRGPIKEKPGGQVFFDADDVDSSSEDFEGENFASRVSDSDVSNDALEPTGWTVEDLSSYHQNEDR